MASGPPAMTPTLPPWSDAMSDGCSVPKWLRLVVPLETPEQIAVCRRHDASYYYGGSKVDRALADGEFFIGLVKSGMEPDQARRYFDAVRNYGGPAHRIPGVSWAFGGERFCYGEKAEPASL